MSARAELFERAYATIERAVVSHGAERQNLIEQAVRLYRAAQALDEKDGEPERRSFDAKPSAP